MKRIENSAGDLIGGWGAFPYLNFQKGNTSLCYTSTQYTKSESGCGLELSVSGIANSKSSRVSPNGEKVRT